MRAVLGAKRLLLVRKVAEEIGWPDAELFSELATGFGLVGNSTRSNVFQQGLKAATLSEEQLMGDAKFLKPALLGKIRASVGGEHSSALYDITVAEAKEKSWLKGPYSPAEWISATTGGGCRSGGSLWSRRISFGQLMICVRIESTTPFQARRGRPCMLGITWCGRLFS